MDMTGPEPDLQSSTRSNTTNEQDPISKDFNQLSPQIFHYIPKTTKNSDDNDLSPQLIIICSWLYALPKHIAKYTSTYQKVYPSSPILLLKQDGPDIIWRPDSWQMDSLKPAVSLIRSSVNEQHTGKPKILMHSFSNGGAYTACQLADAYALQAQSSRKLLPISALLIDSAPSIPTLSTGYTAMAQGLPSSLPGPVRLLGGLAVYSTVVVASAVGKLLGVEGVIVGMRRKLNDEAGAFMQEGLTRVYIYSESDEIVPWHHVEEHAQEARDSHDRRVVGSGDKLVRMEKFQGSRHVAHVMVDPDRYWKIVRSLVDQ